MKEPASLTLSSSDSDRGFSDIKYRASTLQVFFLGVALANQGQYSLWNTSLNAGFWSYFVATIWTSVAYICLAMSLAEMTSTMPFSGKKQPPRHLQITRFSNKFL